MTLETFQKISELLALKGVKNFVEYPGFIAIDHPSGKGSLSFGDQGETFSGEVWPGEVGDGEISEALDSTLSSETTDAERCADWIFVCYQEARSACGLPLLGSVAAESCDDWVRRVAPNVPTNGTVKSRETLLAENKAFRDRDLLVLMLLQDIRVVWDAEGFGSDKTASELMYARLKAAIEQLTASCGGGR